MARIRTAQTKSPPTSFGARLEQAARAAGFETQRDLARRMTGYSVSTISRWYNNVNAPSDTTLIRLAALLGPSANVDTLRGWLGRAPLSPQATQSRPGDGHLGHLVSDLSQQTAVLQDRVRRLEGEFRIVLPELGEGADLVRVDRSQVSSVAPGDLVVIHQVARDEVAPGTAIAVHEDDAIVVRKSPADGVPDGYLGVAARRYRSLELQPSRAPARGTV